MERTSSPRFHFVLIRDVHETGARAAPIYPLGDAGGNAEGHIVPPMSPFLLTETQHAWLVAKEAPDRCRGESPHFSELFSAVMVFGERGEWCCRRRHSLLAATSTCGDLSRRSLYENDDPLARHLHGNRCKLSARAI